MNIHTAHNTHGDHRSDQKIFLLSAQHCVTVCECVLTKEQGNKLCSKKMTMFKKKKFAKAISPQGLKGILIFLRKNQEEIFKKITRKEASCCDHHHHHFTGLQPDEICVCECESAHYERKNCIIF